MKIDLPQFPDIDQFRKALTVKPERIEAGQSYKPGREMLAITPEAHKMIGEFLGALMLYVPISMNVTEEALKVLIDELPADEAAQYKALLYDLIEKRAMLQTLTHVSKAAR